MNLPNFDEIEIDLSEAYDNIYAQKKFSINNTTQIPFKVKTDIFNILNLMEFYGVTTGIMIGYIPISENNFIFLFIFDYDIIIIQDLDLKKYIQFFNKIVNKTSHYYLNIQSKQKFEELNLEEIKTPKNDEFVNQTDLCQIIRCQIANCIIKKSFIRTLNRYNESKFVKSSKKLKYDDFIQIYLSNFSLYFNVEDQFLYVLKCFNKLYEEDLIRYTHENNFYTFNENKHPFICKFYDVINNDQYIYIAIEYIEGKTLKDLIEKKTIELTNDQIIMIILEIMCALEYLHLNEYVYRDLKSDNIMIDSNMNAKLIDFDNCKLYDGSENTADIGVDSYMSPEQKNSNFYSYETDIYSLGKIIHFILTKGQGMNNLTKSPVGYETLFNIYKDCFNISVNRRPNISQIFNEFIFIYINSNLPLKPLISIRETLFESLNQDKKEFYSDLSFFLGVYYYYNGENPKDIHKSIYYLTNSSKNNIIIRSKARYFLGLIYIESKHIPRDVNKSITYFLSALNLKNYEAAYSLGNLYYNGEYVLKDINKAIKYLTIAADNNISAAQFSLGHIYLKDKNFTKDSNKAVYYLTLAASQNNPDAHNELGMMYYDGNNIEQNVEKAIFHLKLASDYGNTNAFNNLGFIYNDGKFFPKDEIKAVSYYSKAAGLQNYYAQYNLGLYFLKSYDNFLKENYDYLSIYNLEQVKMSYSTIIQDGLFYLNLAANQNYYLAQYELGCIYFEGKYVDQDVPKAIEYFRLSADQNYPEACNRIGFIYIEGKYISKDVKKAIHYFTLSANQNNSIGQGFLGLLYISGEIVTQNIERGIHYLQLSASQNNPEAQFYLGCIYYNGIYLSPDLPRAIYYLTLSAKQNFQQAFYALGLIYYTGEYWPKDIKKSISLLTIAANQNNTDAQILLWTIYEKEKNVPYDFNKALNYLLMAAQTNNSTALNQLGIIYFNGKYLPKNIKKSIYYFKLSANQNDQYAEMCLGHIYQNGINVAIDIIRAIYYFSLSANQNNSYAQYRLGEIYMTNDKVKDIKKALYYFTLSANQYNDKSLFILGKIYYDGIFVQRDVKKSIHFFTLAANQNNQYAQFNLGNLYLSDCLERNINKAIHYLTLSAHNNNSLAQFHLGFIYLTGSYLEKDIKKGLYYLKYASKNGEHDAQLYLADLYLEGKYIDRNVNEAIRLYKNVSNFYNYYAKNNLGVIYRNGIEKIEKNIAAAKVYLKEAIKYSDDKIILFNLANTLLDEDESFDNIKESINLLSRIQADHLFFQFIYVLLIIHHDIIQPHVDDILDGKQLFYEYYNKYDYFKTNQDKYERLLKLYKKLRSMSIIYTAEGWKFYEELNEVKRYIEGFAKDIDDHFYEGFGII